MKIKKGDLVEVLSGADRGKTGKVLFVDIAKYRALVEGVKFMKKATRPSQNNPQGGIIEREAPINLSNLMLVVDGKRTRVGFKTLEDGKKVRFAKSTGETVNE